MRADNPFPPMINREIAICFIFFFLSQLGIAQWDPPDYLRDIPVRDDCRKTQGRIGMSFQPSLFNLRGVIFLCPDRAVAIDKQHPGASFFFRVHEYGHLALGSRDEAAADAWAAEQLSRTDGGRAVLLAVLGHFVDIGDRFSPYYGTGFYRGLNVATTARIDHKEWPRELVVYQQKWEDRIERNGSVSFRSEQQSVFDGIAVIDGKTLGFFDTRYVDRLLALPALDEGMHRLSLIDVWHYRPGATNRLQANTKGMSATASFTLSKPAVLVGYISEADSELSVEVKGAR
jgi:hypothetical protein